MEPAQLAARTGTAERYVREWLAAQAAGGYVDYHPDSGHYSLPPEHAMALAVEDSPVFLQGGFDVIGAVMADEPKIADAFRTGDGVGWHEHDQRLYGATERFFREGEGRAMNGSRGSGRLTRKALRAPLALYDCGLGWVLGERFLCLAHVGRRSGRRYRTVLAVVGRCPRQGEVVVLSGWGRAADWFRNVQAGGAVEVTVGRRRFRPAWRLLDEDEAVDVLAAYEQRMRWFAPLVRRVFTRLVGWNYDGSDDSRRRLVRELPLVGLRPAGED